MTHPQAYSEIVIQRVEPQGGGLIAGPFEFGIIVLDGQITDIFTEGRRPVPRGGILGMGRRADVRAYIAYTRPFDLAFWLKDPDDYMSTDDGVTLDMPVLTGDGQIVAARVGLTLSVMRDRVDSLLLLLGQRNWITALDLSNLIKHELSGKVLSLNLRDYTAAQLRGNEYLLRQMAGSLERELSSTITGYYGLRLTNFHINWGLTIEERERIKQQKHAGRIRDFERNQELHRATPGFAAQTIVDRSAQPPTQPARPAYPMPPAAPQPSPAPSRPRRAPAAPTATGGYCYVYTDIPTRTSRIHKSSCYYYKNRATARRDDSWWHGPYASVQQAKSTIDAQDYVRVCKVCNP